MAEHSFSQILVFSLYLLSLVLMGKYLYKVKRVEDFSYVGIHLVTLFLAIATIWSL